MKKIVLFLLAFQGLMAQPPAIKKKMDSLQIALNQNPPAAAKSKIYTELAKIYRNINPNQGLDFGHKAMEIAQKLSNPDLIATAHMAQGVNLNNLGQIDSAKAHYDRALKLAKETVLKADVHQLLAKYYLSEGDYSQSLKNSLLALKIYESQNNLKGIAEANYLMGTVYNYIENPEKAISHYQKALAIAKKMNNPASICANLMGIGFQYQNKGEYLKALPYLEQSLEMAQKAGDPFSLGNACKSIAEINFKLNRLEKSIEFLNQSETYASQTGNLRLIYSIYFLRGKIYLSLYEKGTRLPGVNLLNDAESNFKKCIEGDQNSGNLAVIAQCYELLSKVYSYQKKYKEAFETHERYTLYQDTLYSEESKQTIQSLEDQRTIELKNKEIQLNKVKLESESRQKYLYISGLVFLLLIGGLLWFQNRQRQKANQKLQLLNQDLEQANRNKTRFFSILNHDLRAPVSNLIHFLHLQKENPDLLDDQTKVRFEKKIITGAEDLLASMEDILLWSKSQMEQFKPNLKKTSIHQVFQDTQKVFSGYMNIDFSYEIQENLFANTDENCLKTIIRNLTSNAINAFAGTEKPSIRWNAQQDDHQIILTITDNGPGAEEQQFKALYDTDQKVGIKSGLGLHLVRDLAKSIEAKIEVKSQIGQGTTIQISLPKKSSL
ncbi:sensor histidine kinase [Flavobacterium sp. CYK-4]|uniref:tetratricopeptide repeat-containing sensor histidine kinase n=1 Tax=Flavobacterium lotistagni TaxID=2709660 RepID=UPI00140A4B4D|nr:tetratricopeptide repeat protein [Flavobacterium lotistagni]NHM06725.1 sensor histidine kinase [Flavobacterium lotistagni]